MAAIALPAFPGVAALTENQVVSREEPTAASLVALTKPREQSFEFPSKGRTCKIVVISHRLPMPAWVEPTISSLVGIQSLPDNWDSYGAREINCDLIGQSLAILEQIMETSSPAPSIVPLGDGGLQFEWHRRQQDLEIEFSSENTPRFFYRNRTTGIEQEGFAGDVTKLAQLLRGIA
jgi:hypothetical protein